MDHALFTPWIINEPRLNYANVTQDLSNLQLVVTYPHKAIATERHGNEDYQQTSLKPGQPRVHN